MNACMYVYVPNTSSPRRVQKRGSDSLELELHRVASHHVDEGNLTWSTGRVASDLSG